MSEEGSGVETTPVKVLPSREPRKSEAVEQFELVQINSLRSAEMVLPVADKLLTRPSSIIGVPE